MEPMTKLKASTLLVKALENEGVDFIFGIPGEENLDLLESRKGSSIKLVLTRHEQAAGFMAATRENARMAVSPRASRGGLLNTVPGHHMDDPSY